MAIKEPTPEQQAILERYREEAIKVGTCTDRADLPALIDVWPKLYKRAGHPAPEFICLMPGPVACRAMLSLWADHDPLEILNMTLIHPNNPNFNEVFQKYLLDSLKAGGHPTTPKGKKKNFEVSTSKALPATWFWGQHEAYWLMYYRAAEAVGIQFTKEQLDRLAEYEVTVRSSLCAWPGENGVVICDRPTALNFEQIPNTKRYRLHAPDSPAVFYPDGSETYVWHGVSVRKDIIMNPQSITFKSINEERNAEIRRVMLEKMGFERYLAESKAKMRDRSDYGTLWEIAPPPGENEPLVLLELVNSTAEPDGSFKKYTFSVPPTMKRAREALAWQYHMREEEYEPIIET
jgi:hypothetical protein